MKTRKCVVCGNDFNLERDRFGAYPKRKTCSKECVMSLNNSHHVCFVESYFNVTFLFFKSYLISLRIGDEGAFFTNIFRKKEVTITTRSVFIAWGYIYVCN